MKPFTQWLCAVALSCMSFVATAGDVEALKKASLEEMIKGVTGNEYTLGEKEKFLSWLSSAKQPTATVKQVLQAVLDKGDSALFPMVIARWKWGRFGFDYLAKHPRAEVTQHLVSRDYFDRMIYRGVPEVVDAAVQISINRNASERTRLRAFQLLNKSGVQTKAQLDALLTVARSATEEPAAVRSEAVKTLFISRDLIPSPKPLIEEFLSDPQLANAATLAAIRIFPRLPSQTQDRVKQEASAKKDLFHEDKIYRYISGTAILNRLGPEVVSGNFTNPEMLEIFKRRIRLEIKSRKKKTGLIPVTPDVLGIASFAYSDAPKDRASSSTMLNSLDPNDLYDLAHAPDPETQSLARLVATRWVASQKPSMSNRPEVNRMREALDLPSSSQFLAEDRRKRDEDNAAKLDKVIASAKKEDLAEVFRNGQQILPLKKDEGGWQRVAEAVSTHGDSELTRQLFLQLPKKPFLTLQKNMEKVFKEDKDPLNRMLAAEYIVEGSPRSSVAVEAFNYTLANRIENHGGFSKSKAETLAEMIMAGADPSSISWRDIAKEIQQMEKQSRLKVLEVLGHEKVAAIRKDLAAHLAPLIDSAARESWGLPANRSFDRATRVNPEHHPVPDPKEAQSALLESIEKGTADVEAVVAALSLRRTNKFRENVVTAVVNKIDAFPNLVDRKKLLDLITKNVATGRSDSEKSAMDLLVACKKELDKMGREGQ